MKPIDRHLLRWATDSYFALQRSGLDRVVAGRVIVSAVTERLLNPNLTRKEPDMRGSDTYGSKTFNAENVSPEGVRLTISRVKLRTFDDGKDKYELSFDESDRTFIVGFTNYQTLKELFGDETDDWEGQRIELFQTKVMYKEKRVPGVRIREVRQKARKDQPTARVVTQDDVDEMDDDGVGRADADDIPFDAGAKAKGRRA